MPDPRGPRLAGERFLGDGRPLGVENKDLGARLLALVALADDARHDHAVALGTHHMGLTVEVRDLGELPGVVPPRQRGAAVDLPEHTCLPSPDRPERPSGRTRRRPPVARWAGRWSCRRHSHRPATGTIAPTTAPAAAGGHLGVMLDRRGCEDSIAAQATAIPDRAMPKRNTRRRSREGVDTAP